MVWSGLVTTDVPCQERFGTSRSDAPHLPGARALAREVLALDVEGYRAAFRGSPLKRAKLPAMKRNAAVVLGNVGTAEDVDVLTRACHDEPLVREHAAGALARLGATGTERR